ncbi:MAG: glycosyltransferase family 1 protein, partial [Proteobacteria bacterium]|nr:glycosyltransferase family 1 protein [Pseudomonadota bacterium]
MQTGRVRGPVLVIPNGVDSSILPTPNDWNTRKTDVVICALKNPNLGKQLATLLQEDGRRVELLCEHMNRFEYLRQIAGAKVGLFLPLPSEGFYLPALEAMMV